MATQHLESFVRLNTAARSDIAWWNSFAEKWNGTSFLYEFSKSNPQVNVFSNASSSWGCGAFCQSQWFQLQWPHPLANCHISTLEMVPIVAAAIVWGHEWRGLSVRFHTDNSAVVALLNQGSVRDNGLMHLMRCLSFVAAKFDFVFSLTHVRGVDNVLADALSRNKLPVFLATYPQANLSPTLLPLAIQELLISKKPDWTSPDWIPLWNSSFSEA